MANSETIWAGALVSLTCGSALVFGIRQFRYLRKSTEGASNDDGRLLRQSAIRRLIVSVALCAAGVLIALPYLNGMASEIEAIAAKRENLAPGQRMPLDAHEQSVSRNYIVMWIAALCLVGTAVILIGIDMYFVRRHWMRRLDRLRHDRNAMMERQLGKLRAERGYTNGYHAGDEKEM